MKRIIKRMLIVLCTVIVTLICSGTVYADDILSESDEVSEQVNSMLEEYDISFAYEDMSDFSIGEIFSAMKNTMSEKIKAPLNVLGVIFIIIIFSSFMQNVGETVLFQNSSANIYNLICAVSATAVISTPLLSVYEDAANAIDRGGGFMLVFVPIFAGITVLSGGITSASLYSGITLTAAETIVQLCDLLLLPLLTLTITLAIAGSVFPNAAVDSFAKLLQKIITWGITVVMTLFVGFISLKGTLAGTADGFAAKTTRFIISGAVPVVGSAVSDAYSTVKGSFDVMRCTSGTAGTIAIVIIMLPPIIELIVFRAVIWTGSSVAEMFSAAPIAKLLKGLDSGLSIALSVLICFSLLFIISTAIMMKSFA